MTEHTSDAGRSAEVAVAKRYFASFSDDYHRAFEGTGANPLHRLINRLFRRRTFQLRSADVRQVLTTLAPAGKHVLDVGCGSGELSIEAARMGARVTGIDVVEGMVAIARELAKTAGVSDRTEFRVGDALSTELPQADICLLVGVIEYYRDAESVITRLCGAAREAVIVVDTRGPLWRRTLRYGLARFKGFNLYYHPPARLVQAARLSGFVETVRRVGHSYTMLVFTPAAG
jgi:2-polyprenyl-3-methyl-5-hydroxy-6-metoxy-1,4-benzoquinol methylase